MSAFCPHLRIASEVITTRLHEETDSELQGFVSEIAIWCQDCGDRFGFRADGVGWNWNSPRTDPKGTTLRVPLVSPAEMELRAMLGDDFLIDHDDPPLGEDEDPLGYN